MPIANTAHPRIDVSLQDIQTQIRMVDRLCATAAEPELGRWTDLGLLLSELYAQLQHQKQVTVHRSSKSAAGPERRGR